MSNDSESQAALAAMERAAEVARLRASRFGSRLALWKDGKVVLVDPSSSSNEESDTASESTSKTKPQKPQRGGR